VDTIHILDTLWIGRPHAVASALLQSSGHRSLIDPGPASTLATLREQLQQHGLTVANLDAILLTHIHLDHAGATGALVKENPRLAVYVHSKGAHHMADPAKLLDSATRLWGTELPRLFGETLPVPSENLRTLEGGEILKLGTRELAVAYTPGHASHHVSYFDEHEGVAFVGDTAGIRIQNGAYILPATPPPDINLELWDASFARILARRPARLFLTHFGYAENPPEHLAEFRERLHHWAELAGQALLGSSGEPAASKNFVTAARAEMVSKLSATDADHYAFTAGLDLSFLGMARYLRKRAQASASTDSPAA
jgi:glyoxylase-like metal-dependent hydrolase (beta-lactamase superfamily II)